MKTYSNKDEITIGRKFGAEILKEIKNARKSVKIVSPYLSPSYLEELVKLNKKGVQITLITADNLEEADGRGHSTFKHSDVIKQKKIPIAGAEKKRKLWIRTSLIIILLSFMISILYLLFQHQLSLYIAFLSFIIGLALLIYSYFIKIYNYEYSSLFRLKIFDSKSGENPLSTNLVHAKIFVIDDKIVFLGSANFTYSAFNTHYETVIKVEDQKAIKDIIKEVEELYNSKELASISINELGKEAYESGLFS